MNKNKFFGYLAVFAIAAMAAWNVNVNSQMSGMSVLSIANVEALAQNESGSDKTCYYQIWGVQGATMEDKRYCPGCEARPCIKWGNPGTC